jgi:predicted fused transcriptional regulator/phosphomethylpyrimidine kinase/predicted transcriptional regulator
LNPPCELTVRILLPALRIMVARQLSENYGWTQTKIAKKLGVTQAAVSGYLTQEVDIATPLFSSEELGTIAKSLTSEMVMKKLNHADLINNVCEICLSLRRGGAICNAHKMKVPELEEEKCTICMQLHMSLADISDERRLILGELRCAVSLLESTPEFSEVVPEVFTNMVMGLKDAKGIADVAGIPGRLVKVRGKVKALMDPEFGVSSHLARLLIGVMKHNPDIRAVANLKCNEGVLGAVKRLNLKHATLRRDPDYGGREDEIFRFAEKSFSKEKGLSVIMDEGGFGIEPNSYFFDESASKLADRAVRVARMVYNAQRK